MQPSPNADLSTRTLYFSPLMWALIVEIIFMSTAYAHSARTHATIQPLDNQFSQVMLAEFLTARQHERQAVKLYQQLALNTLSPSLLERALSVAISHQDLVTALHIAQYWVENEPNDIPALFYLAHLALSTHDYPLAAHALDSILSYDSDAALDRVLLGIYPQDEADRQQLLQALMRLDTHNNPSLLVLMAGLQAQNGQLDEALKRVERALKKRPEVTAFMTLKANILIAQNKHKQLAQWLHKQNLKQPNNKSLHLFEVRYLLKQNQQQRALDRLIKMTLRWSDDSEITLLTGLVCIDQAHHQLAERYLQQLITQDDYVDQAYYYLAINAQRQNDATTAIHYFKKVEGKLYEGAQKKLVLMMATHEQLNQAIAHLTQQRVDHPDESIFLYQLQIQLLKDNGQLAAARQLLDEALSSYPDNAELIYARAIILKPTEQQLLSAELERLLSIEPNNPTYLNAYAYMLATQNRQLKDARLLAERANALKPNQGAILDTLGFVALQQKDYRTAIDTLKQAYALDNNINIALHLIQAYQDTNDHTAYQTLRQQLYNQHPADQRVLNLP